MALLTSLRKNSLTQFSDLVTCKWFSCHLPFRHLIPHSEILYLMEPFILKRLGEFQTDRLNQLASYYIRLQRGSELFMKQLFAQLALRQEGAALSSQVALLQVLEPKIMNRSDLKLDLTKEVRLLAKEMMKRLNQLKAEQHLPVIVPRLLSF